MGYKLTMASARASRVSRALLVLLAVSGATLVGQSALPPIWKGVYTEAQARRGRTVFEAHCATCHDESLTGSEGPALVGGNFERNWGSRGLDRLFAKIQQRMPPNDESSVTDTDKLAIVAYVLKANGFPAGAEELRPDPAHLFAIQVVGRNGPGPAPNGAIVAVTGCLAEGAGVWTLTHSTEPVVAMLDAPAAGAAAAAGRPLGTGTVTLLDVYPRPDAYKGHAVLARGLLIRTGDAVKLNVIDLTDAGPVCPS